MTIDLVLQSTGMSVLMDRLRTMGSNTGEGLADFLIALAVVLVGWALATVVGRLVRLLLRALRFNDAARRLLGVGTLGAHEPASIAGWLSYWAIIGIAVVLAFDTLGFDLSQSLTIRLNEVLPRVMTAAVLLVVGVVIAMAMGALTRRFFDTAGLGGGRSRGQIVTILLTFFSVLIALDQLGFAAQFVMAIGVTLAAALGLAAALAFGLGCRDLARDFVVEYLRSLESDERPRP